VYDPDVGLIDKTDVLPAASLRYSLGETTNLRLGYSETLNRPDLRELSSGEWEDSDRARKFVGNADLQQAQLTNYDLRIEWFPSADELLAASAFYKDLGQPIEYAVRVATGSNDPIYQPVNATEGHIRGLEFESRVGLGRVGGGLMERLGVSANVTLIDSEAKLPPELGEQADNQRPLTGQSEYMVNAGVFYRSEGGSLSSGVQYNTFGRRIEAIGVLSTPNIWEEPRHTLDFTSTYRWGMASLKFSFENLLDTPVRYTQGGQDTQRWETGRTITLAIGYGNR
jgi:TonB-dependent receptor